MPHIIHTLADTLSLVTEGVHELTIQNAPGSAFYAGIGYYHALYEEVKRQAPHITWHFVLDCSDDPAMVQQAIHLGFRTVLFSGAEEVGVKLREIGSRAGVEVVFTVRASCPL